MDTSTNPNVAENGRKALYDKFLEDLSSRGEDDEAPATKLQSLCRMNPSPNNVDYYAPDEARLFTPDERRQFLSRVYEPVLNREKVYGFGHDEKTLKMSLLNEKTPDPIKLLGVVGMLGVGKTALCRLILDEEEVKQHYFPRILVTVSESEEPKSMEKVAERMLEHLGVDEETIDSISKENKLPGLLYALHLRLKGKKFLLVLDDVKEEDEYYEKLASCIRDGHGFPKGYGGAVILNGRHEEAIKKIVGERKVHRVELLSGQDDCWKIYQTLALGEDGIHMYGRVEVDPSEQVKEELKKKCGGLPLAARIMGELKHREKAAAFKTLGEAKHQNDTAKTSGEGPNDAAKPSGEDDSRGTASASTLEPKP
ncbi:hypothetical protein HRI_004270800 [Hibiscus trionum]|uniref:NB-ARC domain-containing protein n=1 Tax=Hibiscus trionum TaxID=183268 RepID=A0A9W7J1F3_HIBTR|nr:hypothetical protein HRI_004270800 [Hibiscus trionum]